VETRTVLLVEDNEMVRRSVELTLQTSGFRVLVAESGEAAIARLRDGGNQVDLLLSDVGLPQMNGKQLLELARGVRPDLPVVFMSGYDMSVVADRHAVTFLQKPFDANELAAALNGALAKAQ
jgi:two-component system, cell cycle sensor histidine kinase and response regulator CckA